MSDEKKRPSKQNDSEEAMSFTVNKTQIFVVLLPIVFLIGLGAGYFLWEYGDTGAGFAADQEEILSRLDDIEELLLLGEVAAAGDPSATETPVNPEEIVRYEIDIYEDDPTLGLEDASITMIEFSDYTCPFCRRHYIETVDKIMTTYEGQIRYIYKDFPRDPNPSSVALTAAVAAQCAHEQDRFWDYHEKLFFMTLPLGTDAYKQYAEDLKLDMDTFTKCLDENRYEDRVMADYNFAANLGVRSTPTFFINGIPVIGAQSFETFKQWIDLELGEGD